MLILNFHGVGPVTRAIDEGERNCWLDQDTFDAVVDLVAGKSHVRLTVDDGNASDHEFILPSLLSRKLTAEFFVCSKRLGQSTFLNDVQVRDLAAKGMTIGSHGAVHRAWRHLTPSELKDEIEGSKVVLETVCKSSIKSAACPFGAYDRTVLAELKRAGYQTVYTSDGGDARRDAWLQARTTITRSMSLNGVRKLIEAGPGFLRQTSITVKSALKRWR